MYAAQPITARSAAEAFAATVTPTAAPAQPAPTTPPSRDAADPRAAAPSTGPWTPGTVTPQPAAQPDEESLAWTPFEHYLPPAGPQRPPQPPPAPRRRPQRPPPPLRARRPLRSP